MKLPNLIAPIIIIVIAAVLRLLPHPANVVPIAAMALFGGVYLDKKYALILPLAAMFVSDIFLGFHQSMPYVYGSFVLTGFIGMWLRKHKSFKSILGATLLSSVFFFLITNFGFWLAYDLYPKTLAGQMEAYVMALPFFRNTLLGDLFYTGMFFGVYEVVLQIINSKSEIRISKQYQNTKNKIKNVLNI